MEQLSGNYTYTTTSTAPYTYMYAGDPTQPLTYSTVTLQEYGNNVTVTPYLNKIMDATNAVDLSKIMNEINEDEEESLWNS